MPKRARSTHWRESVAAKLPAAGLQQVSCLVCSFLDGTEPFGFVDGISQPKVDWERKRAADSALQIHYGNDVALGEFLLGYPNEYGKYTERPLLSAQDDPQAACCRRRGLRRAQRDLGRNGSYLVLRQLEQDVAGFWSFLDRAGVRQCRGQATQACRGYGGAAHERRPLRSPPLARRPILGVGPKADDDST